MVIYKIIIQFVHYLVLIYFIFFLTNCSNVTTKSERLDENIIKYPDPRQREIRKKIDNQGNFLANLFKSENKRNINGVSLNVNPFIWQASLDILSSTMPLASVDSNSGIIITDWYNENNQNNDSIKIMVQFLSNDIRADGLKVTVYDKKCNSNNSSNCSTSVNEANSIGQELKLAILRKAAEMKNIQTEKERQKNKKKIGPDDPYKTSGD